MTHGASQAVPWGVRWWHKGAHTLQTGAQVRGPDGATDSCSDSLDGWCAPRRAAALCARACPGAQGHTRTTEADVQKRCARQGETYRVTSAEKRSKAPHISESMAGTA